MRFFYEAINRYHVNLIRFDTFQNVVVRFASPSLLIQVKSASLNFCTRITEQENKKRLFYSNITFHH